MNHINKGLAMIFSSLSLLGATSCGGDADSLASGIDISGIDTTIRPQDDFYSFACRGWMQNHPLTGEYSRYGSFDEVGEKNKEQMRALIEDLAKGEHEKGSVGYKLSTLYKVYMDSARQDREGIAVLKGDMERIAGISRDDIAPLIAEFGKIDVDMFFSIYIGADDKNSDMNIIHTYQSGLSLNNRDYYLDDKDEKMLKIRAEFERHIERMFLLFGFDKDYAKDAREAVMRIETRLAKSHFTKEQLRDPQKNYHKITIGELKDKTAGFDWDGYFGALGLKEDSVNLSQEEPIAEAVSIILNEDLDALRKYMMWHLIDNAAGCVGAEIYDANFDFYGKVLQGKTEPSPRWKRAVSLLSGSLGEALGEMYVAKYFPPQNKERMLALVHNLQSAYAERIRANKWMSEQTKEKALEKLSKLTIKIGYPDKFRDYSKLEINEESLWDNVKRIRLFNTQRILDRAGKPVDKTEWHMTPQTVNAYYSPSTNEICFPAGILQRPFFDMSADDAFNYGAIGVVIGHEMTHGFDDQGRQFDSKGNLNDWWTEEDARLFTEQAKNLSDHFDSITVAPNLKANGKFTLGENLADYGGLKIAFTAFMNATKGKEDTKDGYTKEQRFFLAYAGVWANNIRPEEIVRRTKEDPHSLGMWRVNGALPQIQEWYDAFGVKEGDTLYLAPEKRVDIW